MTILIFVLFAFGIMNIIHHITMIEQLKEVKRKQHDILDALEYMIDTMDDTLYDDEEDRWNYQNKTVLTVSMQDHHLFLIRMIRSGCLVDLHHQSQDPEPKSQSLRIGESSQKISGVENGKSILTKLCYNYKQNHES